MGDWQVNGIMSFLSATPLDVISGANTAGIQEAAAQRPNLLSGMNVYLPDKRDPLHISTLMHSRCPVLVS